MPRRDGGDLLRQIEREYPHIVRILMTAYADKDVLIDTVNSGEVFRILEKPLDWADLRKTLRLATELARKRISNHQKLIAIDETLSFLAHELTTPLATIINFTRGIERRITESAAPDPCAQVGQATAAIHDNARYCLTVLSAFVDSVRNTSITLTGNSLSTASQLISSLLDTYPLTPDQRAIIRIDIKEDFHITMLPNCVALVLSSLLCNALRALHDQTAAILCFTVSTDGGPQIQISDNGPGIPPHVLARLEVDPITIHADASGAGRGIIFCNRIMQSFGGSLLIHSDPANGTNVTLNFPRVKDYSEGDDR